MTRMLSRFGITRQIALVGALGVLGLIIVGIVYYVGAALQTSAQQQIEAANARVARLSAIKINLSETRVIEKDFLLHHKNKYVQFHEDTTNAASSDIKTLRDLSGAETIATIDRLTPLIASYGAQFEAVVQVSRKIGLDESSGSISAA